MSEQYYAILQRLGKKTDGKLDYKKKIVVEFKQAGRKGGQRGLWFTNDLTTGREYTYYDVDGYEVHIEVGVMFDMIMKKEKFENIGLILYMDRTDRGVMPPQ